MEEIIVNNKERTVIYDTDKKIYKKYVRPTFKEKIKIFLGFKRSNGENAAFLSKFLKEHGIRTYEVISYTKYSYITKEVEGKTLLDTILEIKNDKLLVKEYLEKYLKIVKKIIDLDLYYADFYFNNLMVDKNGEIYIIDIDEMQLTWYTKHFKNKKVIPRLKQTLWIQFTRLKGYGIDLDIDIKGMYEGIIKE